MYCKNCGAEIMDGSKVCVMCGFPTAGHGEVQDVQIDAAAEQPFPEDETLVQPKPAAEFAAGEPATVDQQPSPDPAPTSLADFYEEDDDSFQGDDTGFFIVPGETGPTTGHNDSRRPTGGGSGSNAVEGRGHKRVGVIVGACVILACVVAASLMFFLPRGEATKAEEKPKVEVQKKEEAAPKEPERLRVMLPVDAPGLDAEGSRVPVRVIGTRSDNTPVDEAGYVAFDGTGLELYAGSYQLSVVESPISATGMLYQVPSEGLAIAVLDTGELVAQGEGVDAVLHLTALDASEVTDELVERARLMVEQDPQKAGIANTLAERALLLRNNADTQNEETNEENRRDTNTNNEANAGNTSYTDTYQTYQDYSNTQDQQTYQTDTQPVQENTTEQQDQTGTTDQQSQETQTTPVVEEPAWQDQTSQDSQSSDSGDVVVSIGAE